MQKCILSKIDMIFIDFVGVKMTHWFSLVLAYLHFLTSTIISLFDSAAHAYFVHFFFYTYI